MASSSLTSLLVDYVFRNMVGMECGIFFFCGIYKKKHKEKHVNIVYIYIYIYIIVEFY
jgi:hypothetical protein